MNNCYCRAMKELRLTATFYTPNTLKVGDNTLGNVNIEVTVSVVFFSCKYVVMIKLIILSKLLYR